MYNIAIIPFAFSLICGIILLIGGPQPDKPVIKNVDYTKCYEKCVAREL